MGNRARFGFGFGCLLSILGPLIAIVFYPRANWLFSFALIGIAVIVAIQLLAPDPTPVEVADRAEQLLKGTCGGWDVDDYEHLNPHEPQLRDLWRRTMEVGGLPEEWPRLDDTEKSLVRELIAKMRALAPPSSQ